MLKCICFVRLEDPTRNYIISLESPRDVFTMRKAVVNGKPAPLTGDVMTLEARADTRKVGDM